MTCDANYHAHLGHILHDIDVLSWTLTTKIRYDR